MPDIYSMSDEELASVDLETLNETPDEVEEESKVDEDELQEMPEDSEETLESETDDESVTEDYEEDNESKETDEVDEDLTEDSTQDTDPFDASDENDQEDKVDKVEAPATTKNKGTKDSTELQKFYDIITSKFKAAGKEVQITNAEDAVALMQQGIGYSQKMGNLKSSITIGKTFEDHGITDPSDISYLIDLHNKDPKAIAKLIKESETDLYEYDVGAGDDYVATNKVQEETKLQSVMNELNHSPEFNTLVTTISSTWDMESKEFIVANPSVLRVLNDQLESGIYAQIVEKVEYERMVGKLRDMPFIEAYSKIESEMTAATPKTKAEPVLKAPRPKPKQNSNNSKKRKASAPQSGSKDSKEVFDAFKMSDEELLAAMNKHN